MVEQPEYKIIKKIDNVEIRQYSACIMAKTTLSINDRNQAFRRIANYIFGGNKKGKQIAMTAPVIMNSSSSKYQMFFIMPKQYSMKDLPKPSSGEVVIEKVPARKIATLRFSGFLSDEKIRIKNRELISKLEKAKIKIKGKPFSMGYNAPWTLPFLRRNEVGVIV